MEYRSSRQMALAIAIGGVVFALAVPALVLADETCMSPYMAKITSQEDFAYVWTLGAEGVGDGSDKLVSIDVRRGSETYGKVLHSESVGGRNEAHHGGFTDDRRYFWGGSLDTSKIFIFDVHTDPAKPRLHKVILLNDDYTPREFVVTVLKAVFCMSKDEAYRVMMTAHRRGPFVVAVYTREVADTPAPSAICRAVGARCNG